jgi:hypothetical protein
MKYNNKYAIALVLLASSAFGASSVPAEPDYDALKTEVMAALGADKTFKGIQDAAKNSLNLSAEQLTAFERKEDEVLDNDKIKKILEEVYKTQVAEAEKQKAEAEAAALEKQKAEELRKAEEAAAAEQEKKKAEAEAAAAALEKQKAEELRKAEEAAAAEKLRKAEEAAAAEQEKKKAEPGTNGGENTPSPDASPSPVDQTEKEKEKEKVVKVAEENKKLAEHKQKEADEKAKENKKLAEQNQKEAEAGANKATADNITKIKAALASVEDFSKLTPEAIKALGLTEKQVEALKKANVTKATTDEDIKKALNAEADATPSAQNKEAKDGANKTTDDPIAKIKAALASVEDFSKLTPEAIKALGLTDKQVEALKKANVTKATTDEDIKKALKGEAETTPNTQNKGAKDINASKDEPTQGDKAEVPFYKNAWIMVPSGVILLSAIGGGVFMMTRKTEDTDL